MACLSFSKSGEWRCFFTGCLSLLLLCPLTGIAKRETHVGSQKQFVNHFNASHIFTTQSTMDFEANEHYPRSDSLYRPSTTEVGFVQLTFPEEFIKFGCPIFKSGASTASSAKHRHKRNLSFQDNSYATSCIGNHDSLVVITSIKSSPASSPFKEYKLCDTTETNETSGEGYLDFKASCCLRDCVVNFEISAPEGTEMVLSFEKLNIPATMLINSDGSHNCVGTSHLFFLEDEYEFCGFRKPPAFRLTRNSARFVFVIQGTEKCHSDRKFVLRGKSYHPVDVEQMVCPRYHVPPRGGKSGHLMSPLFDKMEHYPRNAKCSWNIAVEDNSLVQLHFEFFHLPPGGGDYLKLNLANVTDELAPVELNITDEDLKNIPDYTIVLPSRTVTVTFITDDAAAAKGFKINYKAMRRDFYIPLVNATSLNCTGFNNRFPEHVACNHRADCEGGEDEVDCPYDDQSFCPGGQRHKDSCYYVVENEQNATWDEAEDICKYNYTADLVTPNTLEEVRILKKLIAVNHSVSETKFYMGLREFTDNKQGIYRNLKKGVDGTTYFALIDEFHSMNVNTCLAWRPSEANSGVHLVNIPCSAPWEVRGTVQKVHFICERRELKSKHLTTTGESGWKENKYRPTYRCRSGERVLITRVYDGVPDCRDASDELQIFSDRFLGRRQMFECRSGSKVDNTHVCDGHDDCLDNSDEVFCHPQVRDLPDFMSCSDGQPVLRTKWCDAVTDCLDGSDENDCKICNKSAADLCPTFGCYSNKWKRDASLECMLLNAEGRWVIETTFEPHVVNAIPPPAKIDPDGYGKVEIQPLTDLDQCPETHVQCPRGYCIPVFMLCNGQEDCPEGEDELEQNCAEFCKNKYKCHKFTICLHQDLVCDGKYQCPLHDDELFCDVYFYCPPHCNCSDREVICRYDDLDLTYMRLKLLYMHPFNEKQKENIGLFFVHYGVYTPKVVVTDLSIKSHTLVAVIAVWIGIERLGILDMPNLCDLDLSRNKIQQIAKEAFNRTKEIRRLNLSYNRLKNFDFLSPLEELEWIDLSVNNLVVLKRDFFRCNKKLRKIKMKRMNIRAIENEAFKGLSKLERLELTGNPVTDFEKDVFLGLIKVSFLSTDNFKLCCSSFAPKSLKNGTCKAPVNEISSCEDILRNMVLRTFLWIMAVLTVLGNTAVLLYRMWEMRTKTSAKGLGYEVFITNLSASDLLMGVYLTIVGTADISYRGIYQLFDQRWKKSALCSFAGFLCMISSEVSAMIICLVTIDRFLALAFPFSRIGFTPYSAKIISIITWFIGFALAGIPLLPPLDYWEFFQHNGVCIPLPITRAVFDGSDYSFGIFIVFNFVIFAIIAIGQALILWAIKTNSMKAVSMKQKRQQIAVARKLALVVITDFLCWFPIGIMGIMSRSGIPIPGEANVVSTIFILPLNSALNPFLYTFSVIRQSRCDKPRDEKSSVQQQNETHPTVSTAVSTILTTDHGLISADENFSESLTNVRMKHVELWLKLGNLTVQDIEDCIKMFDTEPMTQHSRSISASDNTTQ